MGSSGNILAVIQNPNPGSPSSGLPGPLGMISAVLIIIVCFGGGILFLRGGSKPPNPNKPPSPNYDGSNQFAKIEMGDGSSQFAKLEDGSKQFDKTSPLDSANQFQKADDQFLKY